MLQSCARIIWNYCFLLTPCDPNGNTDGAKLQSKLRNLSKSQLLITGNSLNSALAIGTLGLWVLRGLCKFRRKQISVGGMQSAFYRPFNFLMSYRQIYCIENAHGQLVRDLDFNPNKQYYLASCGDDCKVKFWDTRNVTEPVKTLEEHSHW